jgi:SNF2 family DNA or RNA helicase
LRLAEVSGYTPPRLRRAIDLLLARDAGIVHNLKRNSPEPLSWTFDTRPGYERCRDRALDLVLPLLLPLRVVDDLYPFQRTGVAWLLRHPRAILADDMGLGKTIQVLAALRRLFRHGQIATCLVIAPGTLIRNWAAESHRWAPELVTTSLESPSGGKAPRDWRSETAKAHIVLASYEAIREPSESMIRRPPDIVVADEAHRLRKSESLAHVALRRIGAPRLWAITGTPVERHAEDLAGLMSLIDPQRFAVDDDRLGVETLRARTRPYLFRRTKDDVLPELPKPHEHIDVVALHQIQREAYDRALREFRPSGSSGYLPLFTKLRSICDLEESSGASSKLDRSVELINSFARDGQKTVVFSYLLEPLRKLLVRLRHESGDVAALLTGNLSAAERQRVIDRFKTDPHCAVLLASLRVGGEGLTLTEASRVIFINRWWNPSSNSQAVDRVVRIGQRKPVTVHYLTCANTVEDRLQPLLDSKRLTFEQLIDALKHQSGTVQEVFSP